MEEEKEAVVEHKECVKCSNHYCKHAMKDLHEECYKHERFEEEK